jgi:hypothetical protein
MMGLFFCYNAIAPTDFIINYRRNVQSIIGATAKTLPPE